MRKVRDFMSTINFCIIAAIVVYLLAMLTIGFVFSKTNENSTDFYLGGRKMGPLVTAMSAEASDMSSWLLMGLPGVAYLSGICDAAWTAIGLAAGTWLNWYFVARRLRRYSANLDAITVPEFYSKRYHDKNNLLDAIAALVIIVFSFPTPPPALRPAASCSTVCSGWITCGPWSSQRWSLWATPSWAVLRRSPPPT